VAADDVLQQEIEGVITRAHGALGTGAIDAQPFSPPAFETLKAKISEYLRDLLTESIKVSRRYNADTVSAAHVERAAEYLVSSMSRRLFRHVGTVGGILFGAALSNLLTMTLAGQFTSSGTLLSAALGFVGAFMVALHIAKD
jgi:hypothetical protein